MRGPPTLDALLFPFATVATGSSLDRLGSVSVFSMMRTRCLAELGSRRHVIRRIANRYADCMAQLVTRVDDHLLADVDALVNEGVAANRSDAVRLGLEGLVEQHRRHQIGQSIVDAYRRRPQTEDELGGLDEATRAMIEEEPW